MAQLRSLSGAGGGWGGFLSGVGEGGGDALAAWMKQKHEEAMKAQDFLRQLRLDVAMGHVSADVANQMTAGMVPTQKGRPSAPFVSPGTAAALDAEQKRQLAQKVLLEPPGSRTTIGPGGEEQTEPIYPTLEHPKPGTFKTGPTNVQAGAREAVVTGARTTAEKGAALPYVEPEATAKVLGTMKGALAVNPATGKTYTEEEAAAKQAARGYQPTTPHEKVLELQGQERVNLEAAAERLKREQWGGLTDDQKATMEHFITGGMAEITKGVWGPIGRIFGFAGQATPEQMQSLVREARKAALSSGYRVVGEVK